MVRPIPIGIEFYKEMVDGDYCYVDKTMLIKGILDGGAKVNLFTRPRRFGKTLAISMLKAFFEDERDEKGNRIDNGRYFEGKKIADCGERYMDMQGKYPVINLTMKSAKQPSYEMAYNVLQKTIAEEFRRHGYVCEGDAHDLDEKQRFQKIIAGSADADAYTTGFACLSRLLKKYH